MSAERQSALEIARSLVNIDDRNMLADAVEQLTRLGGFAPRDKQAPILPFEAFDNEQREMLRLVAAKAVGRNQPISGWTGAGIPKDTPSLRRWTDVLPRAVLEYPVVHEGQTHPRWWVMQTLHQSGLDWTRIAERLAPTMPPTEWCAVVFTLLTNAYGLHGRFGAALGVGDLERALAAAGPEGVRWADETLTWLAANEIDPVICGIVTPKMLSPLLQVTVAHGRPIESCFDLLIEWSNEQRAVIAAIPEKRRHAAAAHIVGGWGASVFAQRFENVEALRDLLVSAELIRALETTARKWPALKPLLPRIKALKTLS